MYIDIDIDTEVTVCHRRLAWKHSSLRWPVVCWVGCYSPCVASSTRKPTGEPRARQISPRRSQSLFPLFYSSTS